MVKLTRIYTRSGDDGTTGLGDGARVAKTSLRVEAYGVVDEANAAIGVAITSCEDDRLRSILTLCQHDLFDVGADLCVPIKEGEDEAERPALRAQPEQTARLERTIDEMNDRLSTLTSFVLPGGTPLAAALHLARTIVRRAERSVVALADVEPINAESVRYLNRLSDLLFVLARVANDDGRSDVLWEPGATRGDSGSEDGG